MVLAINTQRLILRPHELIDAPFMAELINEKEVVLMTRLPYPYTLKDAHQWIGQSHELFKRGEAVSFSIILAKTQQLIGGIGLTINTKQRQAELGFWLGKSYWQQGYATEAAIAMLHYAREQLDLNYIYSQVVVENTASINVLEKLGMHRESILLNVRERFAYQFNMYVYAIVLNEHPAE